jgi:phage gp37-like protein
VVDATDMLLDANIAAGTLRGGLDADDVILAFAGSTGWLGAARVSGRWRFVSQVSLLRSARGRGARSSVRSRRQHGLGRPEITEVEWMSRNEHAEAAGLA